GFWLPSDAKPNRRSNWVSNDILTGTLKAIEAKHVMIVADSCYSGRLVRGAKVSIGDPEYLKKISRKKARVVITSGGLEPVADNAGDGHSPFTSALLKSLRANNGVVDGNSLFNKIRRPVMVSADQTPQFSDIRKAGHDGGDFLFVRRK
ncbi:MAG: caspase family protein, partial [Rhodospirillaceae bacterium]|nr:caspase family protein [Rhodospirillaceae bacterium]